MTPFKTPKQMMMEMAGLPHYAGGREVLGKYVSSGVKQLMDEAVKRFTRSAGRAPHPQEMAELEQHAQQFARPKYTPNTDPVTQARAAHALRVDPNINTEMAPIYARDPFLTQQAFGRGVKGTHFAPETLDINDQKVAQMVGEEVGGFRSAGAPKASLTPGAEWMVEKSEDVIARQLGGKGDIGGQLKQAFLEKTGRNPNEDEMNALIAAFNPARHNFTGQQIGDVLVQRPKSRVGMPEWRENARATGLPESYTEHRPLGYSQNLKDEMALASGQVPSAQPEFEREAAKIAKRRNRPAPEPKEVTYDENGVPHYHYAGGGVITPRDMQADLMVHNRYAGGRTVSPDEFMDVQKYLADRDKAERAKQAQRTREVPGNVSNYFAGLGDRAGSELDAFHGSSPEISRFPSVRSLVSDFDRPPELREHKMTPSFEFNPDKPLMAGRPGQDFREAIDARFPYAGPKMRPLIAAGLSGVATPLHGMAHLMKSDSGPTYSDRLEDLKRAAWDIDPKGSEAGVMGGSFLDPAMVGAGNLVAPLWRPTKAIAQSLYRGAKSKLGFNK